MSKRGRRKLDRQTLIDELAKIAFADVGGLACWQDGQMHLLDSYDMDEDALAAVESITPSSYGPKVKFYNKLTAIGQLLRLEEGKKNTDEASSPMSEALLKLQALSEEYASHHFIHPEEDEDDDDAEA